MPASSRIPDGPVWWRAVRDFFDAEYPDRTIAMDRDKATPMADRFFQVLIDKNQGFENGAQFIGEIPLSKAVAHRHLYEETLIVVSGEGCLWTDNVKTPVAPGDVIFLPPRQRHSLECTRAEGLLVAGGDLPRRQSLDQLLASRRGGATPSGSRRHRGRDALAPREVSRWASRREA